LIFSGLFAMHGMAATSSTTVSSMTGASSESVPRSLVGGMPHQEAAKGSMPSAPAHDPSLPGHGSHPGEICLALLVLTALLVALVGATVLRLVGPAPRRGTCVWRGPPLARPPNLSQLSVLRI
jgi:hypothetical protein